MLMSQKLTRISVIGIALTLLAIGGFVLVGMVVPASADGPDGFLRGGPAGAHFGDKGDKVEQHDEYLAEELGISVEALQEAREAVRQRMLDEAVANGDVTQEQVDLMEASQALREYIDPQAIMADTLGMTAEELQAELDAGTSIRDLISTAGLDFAGLREATQAGYEAAVQQAVNDGVITQEQADQLQEKVDGMKDGMKDRRGGPRGGNDGDGGRFPLAPNSNSTDRPVDGNSL